MRPARHQCAPRYELLCKHGIIRDAVEACVVLSTAYTAGCSPVDVGALGDGAVVSPSREQLCGAGVQAPAHAVASRPAGFVLCRRERGAGGGGGRGGRRGGQARGCAQASSIAFCGQTKAIVSVLSVLCKHNLSPCNSLCVPVRGQICDHLHHHAINPTISFRVPE